MAGLPSHPKMSNTELDKSYFNFFKEFIRIHLTIFYYTYFDVYQKHTHVVIIFDKGYLINNPYILLQKYKAKLTLQCDVWEII